jgi:hypothetical protein
VHRQPCRKEIDVSNSAKLAETDKLVINTQICSTILEKK